MRDVVGNINGLEGDLSASYASIGSDRYVFSIEFSANCAQHRQSMQLERIIKLAEGGFEIEEECAALLDVSSDLTQHAILQSNTEHDRSSSLYDRRILVIGEEPEASQNHLAFIDRYCLPLREKGAVVLYSDQEGGGDVLVDKMSFDLIISVINNSNYNFADLAKKIVSKENLKLIGLSSMGYDSYHNIVDSRAYLGDRVGIAFVLSLIHI